MKQINNSLKRQESNNLVMWSILIIGSIYSSIFSVSAQNSKMFLIAGQSNAVGNSDDVTKSPICISGTAFEYNILTDSFQSLKDPIGQNLNNLQQGKGSIGPAFAKTLNSIIGEKILIVSAARGGASNSNKGELSPYGTWDENGELKVFEFAVSKVNHAIKRSGLPLSGIIWLQGERDANAILAGKETESEYKQALEKLISRFRFQFGSNLPFYIVLTGLQTNVATTGTMVVRKVQCEIAKTVPNVHIAYTSTNTFPSKGWLWDIVHYKQEGYNSIGDSVARFVSKIKYDTISSIIDTVSHKPHFANPHIIVDNTSTGCTFDSEWILSYYSSGFYGINYAQDGNINSAQSMWAQWELNKLVTGKYNVYIRWTSANGRPIDAPVEIQHADGIFSTFIDQSTNGGQWNYLGTFNFNEGDKAKVKLSASSVGSTIADAVLFEQISTISSLTKLVLTFNFVCHC